MCIKKLFYAFVLSVNVFLGGYANADDSNLEMSDLLLVEAAVAFGMLVFSDNPKEWGTFMIATSPIVAAAGESTEHPVTTYIFTVAALAGYGYWLKNQEDEEKSDTFEKQFLTFNAIMIPVWAFDMASDSEEPAESTQFLIGADPISRSAMLTYTIRF